MSDLDCGPFARRPMEKKWHVSQVKFMKNHEAGLALNTATYYLFSVMYYLKFSRCSAKQ